MKRGRVLIMLAVLAAPALLGLSGCTSMGVASGVESASSGAAERADLQVVADLPPPPDTQNGTEQLIAPNDLLNLNVFQVADLSGDTQVDARGRATLPLIGQVPAAGMSLAQFQAEITRLYGATYLQSPDITVSMKASAGQRVTVDGEVNRAGIYPTSSQSTLIQVIAQAGGLTQVADDNKVFVYRDFGAGRRVAQYSIAAIRSGQRPDPRIYGGDVLVVFASGAAIAMQNLRQALGLATGAVTLGRL